jgi:signal transduction histidine kinase
MSHELRTPLSAIIGNTGLARGRLLDSGAANDATLRTQLERVEQASQHLLGLIKDILDLSKIEADRMALDELPLQLTQVLDTVVLLSGHRAEEKGLELRLSLAPALGVCMLLGDPLRLKQILLNLVDNAIKFTARGHVEVRVREVVEAVEGPGAVAVRAGRQQHHTPVWWHWAGPGDLPAAGATHGRPDRF